MRKRGWRAGLSWLAGLSLLLTAPARAQDDTETAPPADDPGAALLDTFYQQLSPVGQWVSMDGLGWCWRPSAAVVGGDFHPYETGGTWIYTADGWEFQTQWDWGDIVFHYGRWYDDANYGWLWQPGTDWAAAQVEWRETDGYAGWMPLPPDGLGVPTDAPAWCFVAFAYFVAPDAYLHSVSGPEATQMYASSQRVTARGPRTGVVKASGTAVVVRSGARVVTPVVVTPLPQQSTAQDQLTQRQRIVHLTPPPSRRTFGQATGGQRPRPFHPSGSSHGTPSPRR